MAHEKTMKNALLIIVTFTLSLFLSCASDDEPIIPGIGVRAHTAVLIGNDMYVFGGGTAGSFVNFLWKTNLTTNLTDDKPWPLLEPDPAPEPRAYHAAVENGGIMYVIGGWSQIGGEKGTFFNEMWRYDIGGNSWTNITANVPAVAGHTAILDGTDIYVFGGYNGTDYLNDLWRCDLSGTCTNLGPGAPPARAYHSASVDEVNDLMYIFGGEDGSTNLNDLWVYSISGDTWEQRTASSTAPPTVSYHTAVLEGFNLYVFGGRGATTNAVWRYDQPTNSYKNNTIAFEDRDPDNDWITDSSGGFVAPTFELNNIIVISGSGSNDGTYTITSIIDNFTIEVSTKDLIPEPAGNTVTMTASGFVSDTIAFVDNTDPAKDQITDSNNGFTTAGFETGDLIVVSGSTKNDGTYLIISAAAGVLDVSSDSLEDEGAGNTVTITENHWAARPVPDPSPSLRSSHSAVFDGTKMYVFGGFAGALNVSFGDLWEYNPDPATTIKWKQMKSLSP